MKTAIGRLVASATALRAFALLDLSYMKTRILFATLLTLALVTAGCAQMLDKYVGVYSSSGVPAKYTVTKEGTTLYVQPTGQLVAPLEATAADKFKTDPPGFVFQFDAAKNQMIIKRGGRERAFTKEK